MSFVMRAVQDAGGQDSPLAGREPQAAAAAMRAAGGEITHQLGIIRAVDARLTAEQRLGTAGVTAPGYLGNLYVWHSCAGFAAGGETR